MELALDSSETRDDFAHGGAPYCAAIPRRRADSVAILLCTFNGARFLPLQLASFEAQDLTDWRLYASDDGSDDNTPALLDEFQKKHGAHKVQLRRGPRRGFVANFLSLICDRALEGDYYALSDQDDIWKPHKLSRARSLLMSAPADVPCMYASRGSLIDEDGTDIGLTPLFRKPPRFRHALVQNIAMGNTMVFNEAARRIVIQVEPDASPALHDWWIYLALTAVGGRVLYDPVPTVAYRIHNRNLIGTNRSRILRAKTLLNRFQGWNDLNIRALQRIRESMPEENKKTLDLFSRSRKRSAGPRIYGLLRSGVYRETLLDNVRLTLAALIGKI
jgi:glycosyltransferase involved in cell wall biosynthesis